MITSARPERRLTSVSGSSSTRVLVDERPGEVPEVARHRARLPLRQQPLPEEHHDRDRADQEGHADEGELEEPEPADAGVVGSLGDDHVDGGPGEREERARVRAEGERQQELGRRHADPDRHQRHHGQERRNGAVDADHRREGGDEQHRQHDHPRATVSRPRDQLLTCPGGSTGRVERLADDEERRDEDHRRVAEPAERLLEVQHARRPQRERDAQGDDADREPVQMNTATVTARIRYVIVWSLTPTGGGSR